MIGKTAVMNYCIPSWITSEPCECFRDRSKIVPGAPYEVCSASQACQGGLEGNDEVHGCKDQCSDVLLSDCSCKLDLGAIQNQGVRYAGPGHVCIPFSTGSDKRVVLPLAQLGMYLEEDSACPSKPTPFNCEEGGTCIQAASEVVCVRRCKPNSTAAEDCDCIVPGGVVTPAVKGQFCSSDGTVQEATPGVCGPDSVSVGGCACQQGGANCPELSYCVGIQGAQECLPPCVVDKINPSADLCACSNESGVFTVPQGGVCARIPGSQYGHINEPLCAQNAIGPCACKRMALDGTDYEVEHVTSGMACIELPFDDENIALPLIAVGDRALEHTACPNKSSGATTATRCIVDNFCISSSGVSECIIECTPDSTATEKCACVGQSVVSQAAAGQYCAKSGAVSSLQGTRCAPNSVSNGNCRCEASDASPCEQMDYCIAPPQSPQKCYPECRRNAANVAGGCACPGDPAELPMAAGAACVCERSRVPRCKALPMCGPSSFGPCACLENPNGNIVLLAEESVACMPDGGGDVLLPICRADFFSVIPCACKISPDPSAKQAVTADTNQACVAKSATAFAVLPKCSQTLSDDCACPVSRDGSSSAAIYCASGSSCQEDPHNPAKNVCWRVCTADSDCPSGSSCLGDGQSRRCAEQCPKGDQLVISSGGCACRLSEVCAAGSACFKAGNPPLCVAAECALNAAAQNPCYCPLDGTKLTKKAALASAEQACVEVDPTTRRNAVLALCDDKLTENCGCTLANAAVVHCGAAACAVDPQRPGESFCLQKCQKGRISTPCACGAAFCAKGKACKAGKCAGGLSAGAIAGIVLGALAAAGGLAAAAYFALRASRRRSQAAQGDQGIRGAGAGGMVLTPAAV